MMSFWRKFRGSGNPDLIPTGNRKSMDLHHQGARWHLKVNIIWFFGHDFSLLLHFHRNAVHFHTKFPLLVFIFPFRNHKEKTLRWEYISENVMFVTCWSSGYFYKVRCCIAIKDVEDAPAELTCFLVQKKS